MTDGSTLRVDEARAIAEALADVLAERGLVAHVPTARVLGVGDVARLLGRRRAWVYQHAEELGAFRFGSGPKARLGFDIGDIERWKQERASSGRRARSRLPDAAAPARKAYRGGRS